MRSFREPFLVVDLVLAPTSDGGRKSGILPGYRCPAVLRDPPKLLPVSARTVTAELHDCLVDFDAERVEPGGSIPARLHPLFPEFWRDLTPGDAVGLYEPLRRVAIATVVEPLPAGSTEDEA